MKILGIESSCDETAASVVENGRLVLSNIVNSQIELHAQYGGVIPEIAARSHIEVINQVIDQALSQAKTTWEKIDAIAVANQPGLIGSLLIGTLTARSLAITQKKPLYAVHHILAHFFANYLTQQEIEFPLLSLTVSGGHSHLMLFNSPTDFRLLGQTVDDAVGEAFDKVAKIIGLGYPGGPKIQAAAKDGDPLKFNFTKPRLKGAYDFSFSGLKTAVLRQAQQQIGEDYTFPSFKIAQRLSNRDKVDLAASFQKTAVDILINQTKKAAADFNPRMVALAGGVAANQLLRSELKKYFKRVVIPEVEYCTDNAAMVASAGYFYSKVIPPANPYLLEVVPSSNLNKIKD